MLESMIKDYKKDTFDQFQVLMECTESFSEFSTYKNKLSDIHNMIERCTPSLMFYGIYNAGKSSVLNAIFGEEKASVNDIPETHKVQEYKWNNYILVDTPGLNGPPEDEKVSLMEVKKRDIIMFVIDDSDNFDSIEITEKIVEILEAKKPCIIVINKKNDSGTEEIYCIKQKINCNIKTLSNISAPEEYYDFVTIDAKAALRAKREEKKALLQESNIRELEYCISRKLISIDEVKMLRVPLENMQEICAEYMEKLKKAIQDYGTEKLLELLNELTYIKNNTLSKFICNLDHLINLYINTLYAQMAEGREAAFDKENCEKEIADLANECMRTYCESIKVKSGNMIDKWRMDFNLSNTNLVEMPQRERIDAKKSTQNNNDSMDDFLDTLENVLIWSPVPVPIPAPVLVPPVLIIKFIKGLKKIIFGSKDEVSVNIDELNDRQREAVEKRKLALMELKNQLTMQMDQFSSSIKESFKNNIEQLDKERREEIEKAIAENEEEQRKLLDLTQKIEASKEQIQSILIEINNY